MNQRCINPIIIKILTFICREFSSSEASNWLRKYDCSLKMTFERSNVNVSQSWYVFNATDKFEPPEDAVLYLEKLINDKYSFPDVSKLSRLYYQGLCRDYYEEFFSKYFGDYLDEAVLVKSRCIEFLFETGDFSIRIPMTPPRHPKVNTFKRIVIKIVKGDTGLSEYITRKNPEKLTMSRMYDIYVVWDVTGKTHYHNFPFDFSKPYIPLDI